MSGKNTIFNKRKIIKKTHMLMMLIVFSGAMVSSLSIMVSFFLVKKMMHNQNVISKQDQTIGVLAKNYESIKKIDNSIKTLSSNQNLLNKKIYPNETALQVILDALPDRANTPALGESLKRSILNVPNIEIEQLSLTKTDDEATDEFAGQSTIAYNTEYKDLPDPSIYFRIKISGTVLGLNQVLKNLEKSIRPMMSDRIEFQSGSHDVDEKGNKLPVEQIRHWLVISARSFYGEMVQPQMTTELISDQKKPDKKVNNSRNKNEKK